MCTMHDATPAVQRCVLAAVSLFSEAVVASMLSNRRLCFFQCSRRVQGCIDSYANLLRAFFKSKILYTTPHASNHVHLHHVQYCHCSFFLIHRVNEIAQKEGVKRCNSVALSKGADHSALLHYLHTISFLHMHRRWTPPHHLVCVPWCYTPKV